MYFSGIINGFTAYPSVVDDIKELVAKYVTVSTRLLLRVHSACTVESVKRQTLPYLCDRVKPLLFWHCNARPLLSHIWMMLCNVLTQDKPNVLMLAVIAAKEDLNLAHALPVANRADPSGMRTIEVYTKMDDAQPYAW